MKRSYSSVSFRRLISFVPFVFLLALFITLSVTPLYADPFTVTTLSDDISNPVEGSLRYAIENATSQDVISFDLEYPAIITLYEQLSIDHGLTIHGPGAELLSVSGGGACRVFYIEDTAESVDISGISIVSGDADKYENSWGGGICNLSNNLTVDSCHFSGNNAFFGSGMFNKESSPTVRNCVFSGNSGGYSAGIYNSSSDAIVTDCNFSNNSANRGTGVYNYKSSPTVMNCTFSSNSATTNGGGMYNFYCDPIVTNCTFSSNSAEYGGGMLNDLYSSPEVTNCTFTGNSAEYGGGGMCNFDSSPTVMNCTFYLNSASEGGGMYNDESSPTVTNCIFWGDRGGEIFNDLDITFPSEPILGYCVVQSSDVGDGTVSSDIISTSPELQPLADNGGPTWTCALGEGSSAIDAGIESILIDLTTIQAPTTDQRGAPRPFNVSFDIGAYESGLEVYEITATCSDGGTISPTEAHTLAGIEDEVFYLMQAEGYEIEAVYVDEGVVSYDEASNTYTFENVSRNHEIRVDFALKHFTITALSCDYGAITPASVDVVYSDDVTFTISPEEYYYLDHLYVDGNLVSPDEGETVTYTFENVSDNHEINADFWLSGTDDDDDDIVNRDSDGCNISALPGIALLLVLPIMFLSGKMK